MLSTPLNPARVWLAILVMACLGVVLTVSLASASAHAAPSHEPTLISISGSELAYSARSLLKQASVVVVARYSGESATHWNNASNTQWAARDAEEMPLIYRDESFDVVRVIRGELGGPFIVRTVGGTVGNVSMRFDGQPTFQKEDVALLLLERRDTPTQAGTESMWTVVAMHQGVFRGDGPEWKNDAGTVVDESAAG